MPTFKQFRLPDAGEGLTEAEILKWYVQPGDLVTVNQAIVEIETAKAAVELPCPFEGVITELLVPEGATVDVGTPIVSVDVDPDGAPGVPAAAQSAVPGGRPDPGRRSEEGGGRARPHRQPGARVAAPRCSSATAPARSPPSAAPRKQPADAPADVRYEAGAPAVPGNGGGGGPAMSTAAANAATAAAFGPESDGYPASDPSPGSPRPVPSADSGQPAPALGSAQAAASLGSGQAAPSAGSARRSRPAARPQRRPVRRPPFNGRACRCWPSRLCASWPGTSVSTSAGV